MISRMPLAQFFKGPIPLNHRGMGGVTKIPCPKHTTGTTHFGTHLRNESNIVRTRVKVCCISSLQEAQLAIHHGADALGLVADMPSGPGIIGEALIREIADAVPPAIATFLLTSHQTVSAIVEQHCRCRTNTIQICDRLVDGTYRQLSYELPGIRLVQVIHVRDETSVEEARHIANQGVHAILLDSGNQNLAVKELGGTGKTHDWALSRAIVASVEVPVFLAGGLMPENAGRAMAMVGPFGLDLCSGVRSNGALDETKLAAFFEAVKAGPSESRTYLQR